MKLIVHITAEMEVDNTDALKDMLDTLGEQAETLRCHGSVIGTVKFDKDIIDL